MVGLCISTERRVADISIAGELVCFFRAPPRISWDTFRDSSKASSKADVSRDGQDDSQGDDSNSPSAPPLQAPSLVSDAVRRLTMSAVDRSPKTNATPHKVAGPGHGSDQVQILRIMTDLLTTSQKQPRRLASQSHSADPGQRNTGLFALKRSTVLMYTTLGYAGSEKVVATGYIFSGSSLGSERNVGEGLVEACQVNAGVARAYGRLDHERVFNILKGVFSITQQADSEWWMNENPVNAMRHVVNHL
jgi:WD repeat-containing protein 59